MPMWWAFMTMMWRDATSVWPSLVTFRPRTLVTGCDNPRWSLCDRYRHFNPRTRVTGCEYRKYRKSLGSSHFNPRTHMGATYYRATSCWRIHISIHTPVWVRHEAVKIIKREFYFNPRTLYRARQYIPILLWSYRFSRRSDFPFRVIGSR